MLEGVGQRTNRLVLPWSYRLRLRLRRRSLRDWWLDRWGNEGGGDAVGISPTSLGLKHLGTSRVTTNPGMVLTTLRGSGGNESASP